MPLTRSDLVRELSIRCDDVVQGIATGGSALTLVDSNQSETFNDDDVFNGGRLVINSGGGNMVFVTDMEAPAPGDFGSVTITDSACKVYRDREFKKTGKWSYKYVTGADASDQAYSSKTVSTTYTTLYAQVHCYAPASYTGAAYILQLQTAAAGAIASVRLTNGVLAVYDHTGAVALTPVSTAFSAETWHRLEIAVVISATVGTIDLWLDEAHIYTGRALNTGSTPLQIVACGLIGTTVAEAKTIYLDDLRVDQSYIGDKLPETEKTISDYTGSTGTFTWVGNSVAPTASVTRYSIYDWAKTWRSKDQKVRAINNAIRFMWPYWYREKVDPPTDYGTAASLTTVQNQAYYQLPDDCERVMNVFIESSSSTAPYWREVNWDMDRSGGVKYLRLPGASGYTTGKDIRIHYMARPVPLDNDNDELNVDETYLGSAQEYIMEAALAQLWGNNTSPTQTDNANRDAHQAKADAIKKFQSMPQRSFVMRVEMAAGPLSFNDRITHP
jgi:hypothetical protein